MPTRIWNEPLQLIAPGPRAYAGAFLTVAASTIGGLLIAPLWGNAAVVLLYFPSVIGAATFCGLRPALLVAVASTAAYNFFFTQPLWTFVIHSPTDIFTVVVLFLVALVTSHLAGSLREQAQIAAGHAARNATIAGFARRLLSCSAMEDIAEVAVRELSRLFGCNVVFLAEDDGPKLIASAPTPANLGASEIAAAALALYTRQPSGRGIRQIDLSDWQYHPIVAGDSALGIAGLARSDGDRPVPEEQLSLLVSLLDQVALGLERARLEREACEFAAMRERDKIRATLLSSIGEDVKPRLTAILGAARALKRAGTAEKHVVSIVAEQAAKLDRYIDTLLDLSPCSEQEPIIIGPLAVDLYRRSVSRDGREVHLTPKEFAVLAELAKQAGRVLTHGQLLRAVWGPAQGSQIEYLRVAIRALRQKLEREPAAPELIHNEPAVGYRLRCNMD